MRLPLALRMAGNTIKRDDITYAGAEYARGFVAKRSQQTTGIITFYLEPQFLCWAVDFAARLVAAVVC